MRVRFPYFWSFPMPEMQRTWLYQVLQPDLMSHATDLRVLDTLGKNCGERIFQQIVERDILPEMVKIVKKKPDLNVRERILILIDTWQEALGGPRGKFPQFYAVYNDLKSAGLVFPPREENSVPLFTPPQTQPITYASQAFEDVTVEAPLDADPSGLSLVEIKNAKELADVLNEMLGALDPKNNEGVHEEVIVELVEQCRNYQKRVLMLITNSMDEELLCQGLALNDDLQRALARHDDIAKGVVNSEPVRTPAAPLLDVKNDHEEEESEDEFQKLTHRSRDNLQRQGRDPAPSRPEPAFVSPLLPPPPSSKRPVFTEAAGSRDYLSGDLYNTERSSRAQEPAPFPGPSPPPEYLNPTASLSPPFSPSPPHRPTNNNSSPLFDQSPFYDESSAMKKSDKLPPAPWDSPPPPVNLPPPPSKHNQRQQFFDQQYPGGPSHSSSGSSSPYDGLVGPTENLSLNSSTPKKEEKSEDALFKDLLDFARSKSSASNPKKPSF
ncbi:hypothetical protein KSS87_004591 [Heliosperma pusillum]|nr:hypothetical protein KSS87_004591 [Heliosperma pusillum]